MSKKLSKHDKSVIRRAAALKTYGWGVRADAGDFRRPRPIRIDGQIVIPDIVARKGKRTRIIEVETPESFNKDRKQRMLLRKHARRKPRTKFMARRVWY